jgi:hypothetical protein
MVCNKLSESKMHGATINTCLPYFAPSTFIVTPTSLLCPARLHYSLRYLRFHRTKLTSSARITGPFSTRISRLPCIFGTKHSKGRFVCMCGISLWYTDKEKNEGNQSQLHFAVTLIYTMQNVSALTTWNFIVCVCVCVCVYVQVNFIYEFCKNARRWLLVKAETCCVI